MEVHAGRQRNAVAYLVGLREVSEDVRPLLERAAQWLILAEAAHAEIVDGLPSA